jgi:hypothetical protein
MARPRKQSEAVRQMMTRRDVDKALSRIASLVATKRGLLDPGAREICDRIKMIDSRETRALMADQLVTALSIRFQESLPILYEALTLIRDFEVYKQPEWLSGRTLDPFPDFESYFRSRVGPALDLIMEMEDAHHLAEQYHTPNTENAP